jgi:DNA-binding PadR family transcriptional regulator
MGLLSEGRNHPYGLEEMIRARNMREWTKIGKSSIYRLLNELESLYLDETNDPSEIKEIREYDDALHFGKDPILEFFEEEVDGRKRKVYALTPAGSYVLAEKVFVVLSNFQGRNDENEQVYGDEDFYIAFSYIGILPKDRQIKALSLSIERMKKHILYMKDGLEKSKQWPFFITGLFLHPMMILKTDIEFFTLILNKIQQGETHLDVNKWL